MLISLTCPRAKWVVKNKIATKNANISRFMLIVEVYKKEQQIIHQLQVCMQRFSNTGQSQQNWSFRNIVEYDLLTNIKRSSLIGWLKAHLKFEAKFKYSYQNLDVAKALKLLFCLRGGCLASHLLHGIRHFMKAPFF